MGGTIFSSDPDPKGGSNLKALWRSHLTSVRWPISYRIRFMARRSFLFYFCFLPLRRGEGHALCGKFHYCQKIGTTTGVVVGLRSGSRLTTTIVDVYFHDFYPWIFLSIFFASLRFCLKNIYLVQKCWLSLKEFCRWDRARLHFPAFKKLLSHLVRFGRSLPAGWSKVAFSNL